MESDIQILTCEFPVPSWNLKKIPFLSWNPDKFPSFDENTRNSELVQQMYGLFTSFSELFSFQKNHNYSYNFQVGNPELRNLLVTEVLCLPTIIRGICAKTTSGPDISIFQDQDLPTLPSSIQYHCPPSLYSFMMTTGENQIIVTHLNLGSLIASCVDVKEFMIVVNHK